MITDDVYLDIRCFRLDGKHNYLISWPDTVNIKFNGTDILRLVPSKLYKRNDKIILINTSLLKLINNCLII